MKSFFYALALTIPLVSHASAQDLKTQVKKITANQTACLDKAQSQVDMSNCSNTAYAAGDKLLNQIYKRMIKDLSDPSTNEDDVEISKRLVRSQRAWVAYRTAQCSYVGTSMLHGSGEGLQILSCEVDMTLKRISDLTDDTNL